MGKAILKISKELWLDIDSGKKRVEIRKLNKDHIQEDYYIHYADLENNDFLGNKQVYVKRYIKPNEITEKTNHKPTIDFVKENYMDEKILILFLLW